MLVKVHKQVLLLSNSERGVEFLTEISDLSGIMKEGEKNITGNNFDTNLDKAEIEKNLDQKVSLKDKNNLNTSKNEKVKFSDQIKNKIKELKPLQ